MALPEIADSSLQGIADNARAQAGTRNIKVMRSTFALQSLIKALLSHTWFYLGIMTKEVNRANRPKPRQIQAIYPMARRQRRSKAPIVSARKRLQLDGAASPRRSPNNPLHILGSVRLYYSTAKPPMAT